MTVGPFLLAVGGFASHGKGAGYSLTTVLVGLGVIMVILIALIVFAFMGTHHPRAIRRFGSLFRRRTGRGT